MLNSSVCICPHMPRHIPGRHFPGVLLPSNGFFTANMQLDVQAWRLMPPTAILSVLTFTAYFAYRIYCLVIAQETVEPSNALGLAWFFVAIEFLIFGS